MLSWEGALLPRQFPAPAIEFLAVSAQRILLRQQPDNAPGLGTVNDRQRVALGVLEHCHRLLDRHLWQQHGVRVVQQIADPVILIGVADAKVPVRQRKMSYPGCDPDGT